MLTLRYLRSCTLSRIMFQWSWWFIFIVFWPNAELKFIVRKGENLSAVSMHNAPSCPVLPQPEPTSFFAVPALLRRWSSMCNSTVHQKQQRPYIDLYALYKRGGRLGEQSLGVGVWQGADYDKHTSQGCSTVSWSHHLVSKRLWPAISPRPPDLRELHCLDTRLLVIHMKDALLRLSNAKEGITSKFEASFRQKC